MKNNKSKPIKHFRWGLIALFTSGAIFLMSQGVSDEQILHNYMIFLSIIIFVLGLVSLFIGKKNNRNSR